jgi:hypothetical protein
MPKLTEFQKHYLESMCKNEIEELEKHANEINSFKRMFDKTDIRLQNDNFKYYPKSGVIATYPNLITYLHQDLIKDKEGLVNLDYLTKIFEKKIFADGYLYGKSFALMAHPYFRRSYSLSNSFSPRFIDLYWRLVDNRIEKFIALDFDCVRIDIDKFGMIELDTWFGAQFNTKIPNIPDGIIKLRPPLYLDDFDISSFFSNTYSLDIKWATKGKIKTFQAEEFKTDNIKVIKNKCEYFPVRYIHAEFDMEAGYFRHFDGAIHFYTANEYYNRRDSDFNYNSKNSSHIKTISEKLFKMNGIITTEIWIEFTSHFFAGNPLIFEYFERKYPKYIKDFLEKTGY